MKFEHIIKMPLVKLTAAQLDEILSLELDTANNEQGDVFVDVENIIDGDTSAPDWLKEICEEALKLNCGLLLCHPA